MAKVDGEIWLFSMIAATDFIVGLCNFFEETGTPIQADPVLGWRKCVDTFSQIAGVEEAYKLTKKYCQSLGEPGKTDPLNQASQGLRLLLSHSDLAFHWGKYHYSDASGGPGKRAMLETGFAQKAAIARISNNGNKYSQNALLACQYGRLVLGLMLDAASKSHSASLTDFFVEAAETGSILKLSRLQTVPFSHVANIGAWCFNRAAILGMIVSKNPAPFIGLVCDPAYAEQFSSFGNSQAALLRSENPGSLGLFRLKHAYSELWGDEAMARALEPGAAMMAKTLANRPMPTSEARRLWSGDTQAGFAVGTYASAEVSALLEAEAHPNRESWRAAFQAGLDIPTEPDSLPVQEQLDAVLEVCGNYFRFYFPQVIDELNST